MFLNDKKRIIFILIKNINILFNIYLIINDIINLCYMGIGPNPQHPPFPNPLVKLKIKNNI